MCTNQIKKSIAKEYSGCNCPACQSDDIETTSEVNLDIRTALQSVKCNNCNLEWDDVYTLTGIDIQETARLEMLNKLNAVGIHIYESEFGYGFTDCEADIYETEMDVLLAAFKHGIDRDLIVTNENRKVDIDDDMPGQYAPVPV
jgi:ribosomal protein S24E